MPGNADEPARSLLRFFDPGTLDANIGFVSKVVGHPHREGEAPAEPPIGVDDG
jgi:hypothetical protein